MGQVYMQIPAVVIPVFLFSLLECTLILPARLRLMNMQRDHALAVRCARPVWHERGPRGPSRTPSNGSSTASTDPRSTWSLDHKPLVYSVFAASLIVAAGVVVGGHIIYTHMPPVYNETVTASLEMPSGTPADVTEAESDRLNTAALELQAELAREYPRYPPSESHDGDGWPRRRRGTAGCGFRASRRRRHHLGEVTIELTAAEGRHLDAGIITDRWREKSARSSEPRDEFLQSLSADGAVTSTSRSPEPTFAEMDAASDKVQEHLKSYQGVFDVHGSVEDGKVGNPTRPQACRLTLGLSEEDLGRQVREAFYGAEAQRIQRGRDELRIMVRYPARRARIAPQPRDDEDSHERRPRAVPFATVAEVKFGKSFSTIFREDRRRVMSVRAAADTIGVDMQRLQDQVEALSRPDCVNNIPASIQLRRRRARSTRIVGKPLVGRGHGALRALWADGHAVPVVSSSRSLS